MSGDDLAPATIEIQWPIGWPSLVWLQPDGFMAMVSSETCDLSKLDWRARAMLRAYAYRITNRLDAIGAEQ